MLEPNAILPIHLLLVGACPISNQQHRCGAITLFDLLAKVSREDAKGCFGHVRQNQGQQMAGCRAKCNIEIAEFIAQFHAAQGPISLAAPAGFTLRMGARAHLVFKVDGLAIALFQTGKDFFLKACSPFTSLRTLVGRPVFF